MFKVLINDVVKKRPLQAPRAYRPKVCKKLEFLESGIRDVGINVKKMERASAECAFEGHIGGGGRIPSSPGREAGQHETDEFERFFHRERPGAGPRLRGRGRLVDRARPVRRGGVGDPLRGAPLNRHEPC